MFKYLINFAIIYLLFKGVSLLLSINKAQKGIKKEFEKHTKQNPVAENKKPSKEKSIEGEYIDYEEIN